MWVSVPEQRRKGSWYWGMGQGQKLNSEDSDPNPRIELGQKGRLECEGNWRILQIQCIVVPPLRPCDPGVWKPQGSGNQQLNILWFVKDSPFQRTINPLLWGELVLSMIKCYFLNHLRIYLNIYLSVYVCAHFIFPELPKRLPCWKPDTWKVSTFQLQPFLVICVFLKILKLLSKWKNCVGFFHLFITQNRFNIFFSNFAKKKKSPLGWNQAWKISPQRTNFLEGCKKVKTGVYNRTFFMHVNT